jgi:hypothetical protein
MRLIDWLHYRKQSYIEGLRAFRVGKRVPSDDLMLGDLARFCRVIDTPFGTTPEETARYVGRLEVFRRITQHVYLPMDELYRLYTTTTGPTEE